MYGLCLTSLASEGEELAVACFWSCMGDTNMWVQGLAGGQLKTGDEREQSVSGRERFSNTKASSFIWNQPIKMVTGQMPKG